MNSERIFTGFGPREELKGELASVVYHFLSEMMAGRSPVIWGDGEQTRDFVYIDDIIDNILLDFQFDTGIKEIGTGISYSLNTVVNMINLYLGTDIQPEHIDKPQQYIENTICSNPCDCKVSLEEGIKKILDRI